MGRRRKNRTHLKGGVASSPGTAEGVPKSFVIKHGQVGSSLAQLVRDMRKVMEPNTASRLKERARNKLKDFFVMAPALGVTHILAFTLTDVAPSLRIVRLSAGPTLSFRVERYSLAKDVVKISRRARSIGSVEYLSPPLLVLASFPAPGPGTPPHLPLLMKAFQTLFPPLAPQTLSLSSARRVVLVAYNAARGTVDLRHFLITVKPYGVSRRVRRVLDRGVDLGSARDVADFVLRGAGAGVDGYESAASSAGEDGEDTVALAEDYVGRNNRRGQKRAVRLDEIGPRMELRLIKIAEGLPGKEGSVIYHEFVKKSRAEAAKQKADHAAKERLRKQRREEQEENIQRKKAQAGEKGGKDDEEEEDGEADQDGSEGGEELEDTGAWDDEEEINGEGESDSEEGSDEEDSDSEEEAPRPPPKKQKTRGKR
ncbi:Brix-domain-containing protein [Amylocystis lapponica]|nr:Brix-domain-containing protein [Amylocystis lapponica]